MRLISSTCLMIDCFWFPATFVLHHPEHGHTVILPIISCIIDGTLDYDKSCPPFASFISLVCPSSEVFRILHYRFELIEPCEYNDLSSKHSSSCKRGGFHTNSLLLMQKEYSEQWALACGEILRILTHYNRPIYKVVQQGGEAERSSLGIHASTSKSADIEPSMPSVHHERKTLRPLSPWITDILLAAPLGIRSDYFRW